ncbi:MAG TPA: FGGY family carbohydrate kinase [Flavisolibacter sp.]|nr:FGGY family carbohydrate kinase [Flavisolibacter sp.]
MKKTPVIAVIDVGKTNKKLFLFDQHYKIVYEKTATLEESVDEDGFPCENIDSLKDLVFQFIEDVENNKDFDLKAVQFTTYGASFVYVDEEGNAVAPLYNYLKPFPKDLKQQFYQTYGGEEKFSTETASPVLGNLNSGMQLYRIKYERPELFKKIINALHLPQYLSFLLTGKFTSDITSIGCHTNLWNFQKAAYHDWLQKESIEDKLPPIVSSDKAFDAINRSYKVGVGLHDSSAALIPYLVNFQDPFVLISTGTWCISLNPFNDTPLTVEELKLDCLCYLGYQGTPVKASRLFAGKEHEEQVKKIAEHFNVDADFYKHVVFNSDALETVDESNFIAHSNTSELINLSVFNRRDLQQFSSAGEAYYQLMHDIVTQQKTSTELILSDNVKRIFVDGGFANNSIYMHLLSRAFPGLEIFAASMAQATALGSALAIHKEWNPLSIPSDLIQLQYYSYKHHSIT